MPADGLTREERLDRVAELLLDGFRLMLAEYCPRCLRRFHAGTDLREVPCDDGTCPDLTDARRATLERERERRAWQARNARLWARHRQRTRALADLLTGRAPPALPRPPRRRRRGP